MQTKPPVFSIITVCYNAAKTLERTIDSVLNQSFNDYEYIIIDGKSTDGTHDILEAYKDRVDTIISEPDNGIYDAMNKGISLAKGDLIGIINSDDWYQPDALESIHKAWQQSDEQAVFHGLCRYYDQGNEGKIMSYHQSILPTANIAHPTCFIPRSLYREHGMYDVQYRLAADYELLLRYYLKGIKFERLENIIANFSSGGISETNSAAMEVLKIRKQHNQISQKGYLLNLVQKRFKTIFGAIKKMIRKP